MNCVLYKHVHVSKVDMRLLLWISIHLALKQIYISNIITTHSFKANIQKQAQNVLNWKLWNSENIPMFACITVTVLAS